MQDERTTEEIAWAAGLFEGEGCCGYGARGDNGKHYVIVSLGSTDKDVVERFVEIMGVGGSLHKRKPGTGGHKSLWVWQVQEAEVVRKVIWLLLPYLGERRRAKALETFRWSESIKSANGVKTHCPKGHRLSGDNLMEEPITRRNVAGELVAYTARRCRECRTSQGRERARVAKGITPDRWRQP